jgi:large subunit ribosomal protein LP0
MSAFADKPDNKYVLRKKKYAKKLRRCVQEYENCLIINVDNVGSKQLQDARIALREGADTEIVMGKNTVIRNILRQEAEANPKLNALIELVEGNCGFVFTKRDLVEVFKIVTEHKIPAAAKVGSLAPLDVVIPAGGTGLDPGQTNFFHAMSVHVPTKIVKGQIEITAPVQVLAAGEKVNSSVSALLAKLGIKPFFYGIRVANVYENGDVYSGAVLSLTDEIILEKIVEGIRIVTALGLEIGFPHAGTVPHSIAAGFKNLLAIALEVNWQFAEAMVLFGEEEDEEEEDEEE